MQDIDVLIIGTGVVGLSAAKEVSKSFKARVKISGILLFRMKLGMVLQD